MLETRIRLYQNPWGDAIVPNLADIIEVVAEERADHVEQQAEAGFYDRNSLALAILNPQAPLWQPSSQTLLATIALGPEGQRFVVNAVAKAVEHRDTGHPAGYGVYVNPALTPQGGFLYGFSTKVDKTIAGASGQNQRQDAYEAGHAAVTFNHLVYTTIEAWFNSGVDRPHWLSDDDKPNELYSQMVEAPFICERRWHDNESDPYEEAPMDMEWEPRHTKTILASDHPGD